MAVKDPYEMLGVGKTASDAEIKKAYRRLARKHHPDVNPGDGAAQKKFQEIAAAYEVLKDPERRARYDKTGDLGGSAEPPPQYTYARGGGPFGSGGSPFGEGASRGASFRWSGDFGDLFSELFSRGAERDEEDDDAALPLKIPFRDAVLGGTVTFRARIPRRCSRCGGTGRTGRTPCPTCHGSGTVVENDRISVRIPAGVTTGSKVRVPGKGRTEQGDLYLALEVEPHPYFRREGDDILADVPITVAEAYNGAEIDVPTIHGPVRARIPAGTASGQKFRLKGRGVVNKQTALAGDHYYRVSIAMPERDSEEGRRLAEEFGRLYKRDPRAELPTGL
ncbi:MAG TPA: J domain-containing protein [Thermoanaerobaculia bacterium]|nr:J domain-containing protein [Thermoanaerobaculia bacterium]